MKVKILMLLTIFTVCYLEQANGFQSTIVPGVMGQMITSMMFSNRHNLQKRASPQSENLMHERALSDTKSVKAQSLESDNEKATEKRKIDSVADATRAGPEEIKAALEEGASDITKKAIKSSPVENEPIKSAAVSGIGSPGRGKGVTKGTIKQGPTGPAEAGKQSAAKTKPIDSSYAESKPVDLSAIYALKSFVKDLENYIGKLAKKYEVAGPQTNSYALTSAPFLPSAHPVYDPIVDSLIYGPRRPRPIYRPNCHTGRPIAYQDPTNQMIRMKLDKLRF